jgi:hypothetical protein
MWTTLISSLNASASGRAFVSKKRAFAICGLALNSHRSPRFCKAATLPAQMNKSPQRQNLNGLELAQAKNNLRLCR